MKKTGITIAAMPVFSIAIDSVALLLVASFISPSARARWTICSKRVGFSCGKTKCCISRICRSNCWYALWLMMCSCSARFATICGGMAYSSQIYRISPKLRCLRFSPISRRRSVVESRKWLTISSKSALSVSWKSIAANSQAREYRC